MDDWLDREAWLRNALWDAQQLRSTIHDGLTSASDLYLKVAMLQDLDALERSIRRAM